MKKLIKNALCVLLAFSTLMPVDLRADIAQAEFDGLKIGRSGDGSMYKFRIVDSGLITAGTLQKIAFDVQANVDYALASGRDRHIADIDLYVYNENGTLIIEDTTSSSRGAVRWRSSYSGTAIAYVHVKKTTGVHPGSYSAVLGILEMERIGKASNPTATATAPAAGP